MLQDSLLRLRSMMTGLHPRGRRWLRFLAGFELDPDTLPRPLPAPGENDFIICGAPRSGTTLLTAMLFQPPGIVTVMEPWDGMRLPPRDLFRSIRREIDETGRLSQGKLDVTMLMREGKVRWVDEGEGAHDVQVQDGYLLGVKWPAFWRYLELLPDTKFLVCVRDPQEVITSFKRIGGRLALGLGYDLAFDRRVNRALSEATRDLALRRVLLYEMVYSNVLPHLNRKNVLTVRYERWFDDPESLLSEVSSFLGVPLNRRPVGIRSPQDAPGLPRRERDLLSANCRSMRELGYSI